MLDYTSIKQLAKQIGRPAKDLVVLAPAKRRARSVVLLRSSQNQVAGRVEPVFILAR